MSDDKNLSFTVKAVINKEKTRVLFAQVDNNFADIMFHFSTLSLGLVMQILLKHFGDKTPVIGSLNNLYKGFTELNSNPFENLHLKYFNFSQNNMFCAFPSGNLEHFTSLPICNPSSTDYFWFLNYFSSKTSFVIRDEDLHIFADVKGSILEFLDNVGVAVADMDGAETKDVTIGVNEIMDFVVRLLVSCRPLTDIILGTPVSSELAAMNSELSAIKPDKKDATFNGKKMFLKLTILKSTNELLFAQADQDFVNYLFSVLFIPFGSVHNLLGSNTCLKNINIWSPIVADVAACNIDTEAIVDKGMYVISDDLSVGRMHLFPFLSFFDDSEASLSDITEVELQIGIDELLSIRKASLTSTRVLTDSLIKPRFDKKRKSREEN